MLQVKSLVKTTAVLLLTSLVVISLARKNFFANLGTPTSNQIFIPGLVEKLPEVDKITLQVADKNLEFIKENDSWQLANGYPLNKRLINNLLLELCNLKLLDKKTANPDKLSQLQLADSNSLKLTLSAKHANTKIIELLLGKSLTVDIGGQSFAKTFVRYADNSQAYLVLGNISVATELSAWIEQPLNSLGSVKNIRKVTLINEQQSPLIFLRGSNEGSFALVNRDDNFNHVNLNNFLSDLVALEFQDALPKRNLVTKNKILDFANPKSLDFKHYAVLSDTKVNLQVIIDTFDDIQYTFKIKANKGQVVAQIEGSFVKNFPHDYPLVSKQLQQVLTTLPIKEQYIFKLSKQDFDTICSAQREILNV